MQEIRSQAAKGIFTKTHLIGLACSFVLGGLSAAILLGRKKSKQQKNTLLKCIGDTPLVYLPRLSEALKSEVYVKLQYLNPFGSSKDRAVSNMILRMENGQKKEIVEASSGSTAISLVQICKILGIKVTLFLTDDLAQDKYTYLETLGANIVKVPQVSIVDSKHFFNQARDYAEKHNALFLNQFDNLDNAAVHHQTTGPEIYQQMNRKIDAFVCGAGTGGTIAGVSKYLKQKTKNKAQIILADPEGSGLYSKIKYGILFTRQQKEGYRLKNPFDTVIQGVGLTRPTKNFDTALVDDSFKIRDSEALHMAHYLIENEGLFAGGSCGVNLAAVVKYCRANPGSKVVTIIHDSGNRYLKKFYSQSFLDEKGIKFAKRESYPSHNLDFIE